MDVLSMYCTYPVQRLKFEETAQKHSIEPSESSEQEDILMLVLIDRSEKEIESGTHSKSLPLVDDIFESCIK